MQVFRWLVAVPRLPAGAGPSADGGGGQTQRRRVRRGCTCGRGGRRPSSLWRGAPASPACGLWGPREGGLGGAGLSPTGQQPRYTPEMARDERILVTRSRVFSLSTVMMACVQALFFSTCCRTSAQVSADASCFYQYRTKLNASTCNV